MSPSLYNYQISDSSFDASSVQPPAYHYSNATSFLDTDWGNPNNLQIPRCAIDFTIPTTMKAPIYMYYRLTNFYQNHRQYIKNFDDTQLLGNIQSTSLLHTNCDPLAVNNEGKIIYPCGLIANSMFNGKTNNSAFYFIFYLNQCNLDTISNFTTLEQPGNSYNFSRNNIAWPTDKQKYGPTKYQISQIAPPPNWAQRYPNGQYTEQYPPPNLATQERFMVWMHVAALPDFRKIWGRNDETDLPAGRYRAYIDMSKSR